MFCVERGFEPGSPTRYKSLPIFCGDEGGLALGHPFWWRLEFGGMNITLEGIATASLKNLAPLHKEKECSAEFLHS